MPRRRCLGSLIRHRAVRESCSLAKTGTARCSVWRWHCVQGGPFRVGGFQATADWRDHDLGERGLRWRHHVGLLRALYNRTDCHTRTMRNAQAGRTGAADDARRRKQVNRRHIHPVRRLANSSVQKSRMFSFRTQAVNDGVSTLGHKIKHLTCFLASQTFDDSERFPVSPHPVTNGFMIHAIKTVWNDAMP
jgi:hypothetical protein